MANITARQPLDVHLFIQNMFFNELSRRHLVGGENIFSLKGERETSSFLKVINKSCEKEKLGRVNLFLIKHYFELMLVERGKLEKILIES